MALSVFSLAVTEAMFALAGSSADDYLSGGGGEDYLYERDDDDEILGLATTGYTEKTGAAPSMGAKAQAEAKDDESHAEIICPITSDRSCRKSDPILYTKRMAPYGAALRVALLNL